ncbi:MAG: O-antigen ligase family protein, partial [Cytophagaceae bacterium]|nr:O-antigen ligase family protein [Cytophagaceae bacterium]
MLQQLLREKQNWFILIFWMAVGIFARPLVFVVVPLHMFALKNRGEWLWLLIGLWVVFTFSDSRQAIFRFTQPFKPVMMVVLAFLFITFPKEKERFRIFRPFIPFFIIAVLSIFNGSPQPFTSFQKTLSYLLLLLIIPGVVQLLLQYERKRFLFHLVMTGTLILGIGLALRFFYPGFVIFGGERFSGLLGNPNGLGIYCFCFLSLFSVIRYHHKYMFTKKQTWFIYGLIGLSLVFCSSRGGIFSSLLFIMGWQLIKRNAMMGVIVMALFYVSYQLVMDNFVEIVTSLGLQDYFRLNTLETGSGRIIAREFAWKHINNSYWWGKGFGYTEYLFFSNQDYFTSLGHQGNSHNSYLTIWLDTGLTGLILFCFGWIMNIIRIARRSPMIWAVFFGAILTTTVESWLAASMNPFT